MFSNGRFWPSQPHIFLALILRESAVVLVAAMKAELEGSVDQGTLVLEELSSIFLSYYRCS
jgi:hypothetical protein